MIEIKFTMPSWCSDGDAYEILTMQRGQAKRMAHALIVIETLRAISGGKPTRDQLQKFSKLRRKRFIQVLKYLLETASIVRSGEGTKFSPFRYALAEKEIHR